ncbi:MAG: nuclear transport factor 2 family protein [Rhizobiales bacterium]|nr:nuclear transport factor 2 family protein [Hyphomicrobiales bacterium]
MSDGASTGTDATISPDEIVAIVREVLEARWRGRREDMDRHYSPDIVVESRGPAEMKPYCGRLSGLRALRDFRRAFVVELEVIEDETLDLMAAGDVALARRRLLLRNRGTGAASELFVWERYRFSGDKIVEIIQQTDTATLARLLGRGDVLSARAD